MGEGFLEATSNRRSIQIPLILECFHAQFTRLHTEKHILPFVDSLHSFVNNQYKTSIEVYYILLDSDCPMHALIQISVFSLLLLLILQKYNLDVVRRTLICCKNGVKSCALFTNGVGRVVRGIVPPIPQFQPREYGYAYF